MRTISFEIADKTILAKTDGGRMVGGTCEHYFAHATFDEEWEGKTLRVTWTNGKEVVTQDWVEGMEIPSECVMPGTLRASWVGVGEDGIETIRTARMSEGIVFDRDGDDLGSEKQEQAKDVVIQAKEQLAELAEHVAEAGAVVEQARQAVIDLLEAIDQGDIMRDSTGQQLVEAVVEIGDALDVEPYMLPAATATTLGGIKVGENLTVAADGTLSATGGGDGKVKDVTVAGVSVIGEDGVAAVPMAGQNVLGVVRTGSGLNMTSDGRIFVADSTESRISNRTFNYALTPGFLDYAVRAALCDGKGAAYTSAEQLAARARIGAADAFETARAIENLRGVAVMEVTETIDGSAQVPAKAAKWADVEAVKGETVVWNQLIKWTYIPTSGSMNGVSFVKGEGGTLSASGTASGDAYIIGSQFAVVKDHKYLFSCTPSGGSSSTFYSYLTVNVNYAQDFGDGVIYTATNSGLTNFVPAFVKQGTTVSNLVFKPRFTDLTAMYGAGNEPTDTSDPRIASIIDHAEAHSEHEPGRLVSVEGVDVVNYGANLLQDSAIEKMADGKYGYGIRALGLTVGETYTFAPTASDRYLLKIASHGGSTSVVQKDNVPLTFTMTEDMIGLHLIYVSRTTWQPPATVEELEQYRMMLVRGSDMPAYNPPRAPITTHITDATLRSAGSARDEWTNGGTARRVGVVDLGTLNWIRANISQAGYSRFYSDAIPGIAIPANDNEAANVVSAPYSTVGVNNLSLSDLGIGVSTNTRVYARNDAYETADAFKQAMTGVQLFYEMTEPVFEPHDPIDNTIETEGGGTLTFDGGSPVARPTATVTYDMPTSN